MERWLASEPPRFAPMSLVRVKLARMNRTLAPAAKNAKMRRQAASLGLADTQPPPLAPTEEQGGSMSRPRDVIRMFEVGREIGLPWRWCRRLLEHAGVEVLSVGPKAWVVRRSDWLRVRDALRGRV